MYIYACIHIHISLICTSSYSYFWAIHLPVGHDVFICGTWHITCGTWRSLTGDMTFSNVCRRVTHHTHTRTHPLSLSLSHTHTHLQKHTHTHTHSRTHTHTHTLSLSFSLSLSYTHTHTHKHTHTGLSWPANVEEWRIFRHIIASEYVPIYHNNNRTCSDQGFLDTRLSKSDASDFFFAAKGLLTPAQRAKVIECVLL